MICQPVLPQLTANAFRRFLFMVLFMALCWIGTISAAPQFPVSMSRFQLCKSIQYQVKFCLSKIHKRAIPVIQAVFAAAWGKNRAGRV